jgi:hypothetical protein
LAKSIRSTCDLTVVGNDNPPLNQPKVPLPETDAVTVTTYTGTGVPDIEVPVVYIIAFPTVPGVMPPLT